MFIETELTNNAFVYEYHEIEFTNNALDYEYHEKMQHSD